MVNNIFTGNNQISFQKKQFLIAAQLERGREKESKFTIMVLTEAMRNDLVIKEYYEDEKKGGVIEGKVK